MKILMSILLTFMMIISPIQEVGAETNIKKLDIDLGWTSKENLDVSERYSLYEKIDGDSIIRRIEKPNVKGNKLKVNRIEVAYVSYDLNDKYRDVKGVKEFNVVEGETYYDIVITPIDSEKIRTVYIDYEIDYPFERGEDLIFYRGKLYDNNTNTLKMDEINMSLYESGMNKLWIPSNNLISKSGTGYGNYKFDMKKGDKLEVILGVRGYNVSMVPITIEENVVDKFNMDYGDSLYEKVEEKPVVNEKTKFRDYSVYIILFSIIFVICIPIVVKMKSRYKIKKASKSSKAYINKSLIVDANGDNEKTGVVGVKVNKKISPILLGVLFDRSDEEILKIALIECLREGFIYKNVDGSIGYEISESKELENKFIKIISCKIDNLNKGDELKEIINKLTKEEKRNFLTLCHENFMERVSNELDMEMTYEEEMKRRAIYSKQWIEMRDKIANSKGDFELITPTSELKKIYVYCYAIGIPTDRLPNIELKELMAKKDKEIFKIFDSIIK
ncbi:MAG: hypothetical protein ACRC7N_11410 [Clostridium sp.]